MNGFRLAFPASAIAGKNELSAADVAILRKYIFPNGVLCHQDVTTLLVLNGCCPVKCPEWEHYFVESLAQFVLHYCYPQGSLDEVNADWIEATLATDGIVNSRLELDALLHIMDLSVEVPPSLSRLALDQLRHALRDNIGPLRSPARSETAGLDSADMAYVIRVLRNDFAGEHLRLAREQIGALLRIGDVVANRDNVGDWEQLLQAISLRRAPQPVRYPALRLATRMREG
ncbi:hypothetical protein [Rhizobium sp. PAMB 3182]